MEYVVVIACGVALALLLNQVMAFAEVQGALKDKIMQVITGQNMVVSVDEDSKEQSLDERKNDFFRRPEWINDLASGYQALKNKFKEGLSETWENVKNIELGEVAQSLWNNTTNALDSVWQWMKENKEVVASAGVIIAGVGLLLIPGLEPLGLMLLANWGLSLGFGALLNGGKVDKTVLLGAAIGGAAGAIGGGVASALFSGLAKFAPGLGAAITGSRFLGPIISGGRQILGKAPALVQRMASGLFSKMGAMAATEGAITSGVDDWLRGKELNWKRAILSGLAGATLVGFASGAYPLVQPLINKATATIEKHAGPVVAKINKLPIPTLEVLEAPGVGKVPNSKTVGDTPFGAWLQKFASNGGNQGTTGKITKNIANIKIEFKKGYDKHLIEVEGFRAKPTIGIKGGHNLRNFEKYILENFSDQVTDIGQVIVSKTPHSKVKGIYEIKYKLPVYDSKSMANGGKGNFTGNWKVYRNPKTVYDPNIISDEQILKLGKEAMAEGISNNRIKIDERVNATSDEITGYADVGGEKLQFIGYRDKVTGEIKNFFPVLSK
ncbi:hypothetical protein [Laceyella tengchongensis]